MNEIVKSGQAVSSQQIEYMPPVDMRRFVQVLLNEGRGSVIETERLTKINRDKFWWRLRRAKDREDFQRWYVRQVDAYFTSFEAPMSKLLLNRAADGDVSAMRLYYEIRGRTKTVGGIQFNQQINVANSVEDIKKIYPDCQGCPQEERQKHEWAIHHLANQIQDILSEYIKDEELNDYNVGNIISLIRKRPSWFKRVLDAALQVEAAKEKGEYSEPEVSCPSWPSFLPCKKGNCPMREPY